MKRPSFQFYPADWRKDAELQSCSIAARGLWAEMLCIMHESNLYGLLAINGKAMGAAQLARLVGETEKIVKPLLEELENAGVFSRTAEGVIFCRRMVRDEQTRNARAEGGKAGKEFGKRGAEHGAKGGRPKKSEGGLETPLKTPLGDEEKPPPSSSSSSSSSSSEQNSPSGELSANPEKRGSRLARDWTIPPDWIDWAQAHNPAWTTGHIREISEKFRDYWVSKAGAAGRKLDWEATWRNWIRNEKTPPRAGVIDFKSAKKAEENDIWERFNRGEIAPNPGSEGDGQDFIDGEFSHGE